MFYSYLSQLYYVGMAIWIPTVLDIVPMLRPLVMTVLDPLVMTVSDPLGGLGRHKKNEQFGQLSLN